MSSPSIPTTLGYSLSAADKKAWGVMMMGPVRWSNLSDSHELYNLGHMIEAAVARYETSDKTDFLDVARRSADLMCRTFGNEPTQIKSTAGHQEVELALAKLYRVTGEKKYLDLAKFFLDMRGRKDLRQIWGADRQDHEPVMSSADSSISPAASGRATVSIIRSTGRCGRRSTERMIFRTTAASRISRLAPR